MFERFRRKSRPRVRDIDPGELAAVEGARLIDVREPNELVGPLGYIHGVDNVPMGTVLAVAGDWDKAEPIVVICRSGGRSSRVAAELASAGFTEVMNLRGGMLAWNQAGLPTAADR